MIYIDNTFNIEKRFFTDSMSSVGGIDITETGEIYGTFVWQKSTNLEDPIVVLAKFDKENFYTIIDTIYQGKGTGGYQPVTFEFDESEHAILSLYTDEESVTLKVNLLGEIIWSLDHTIIKTSRNALGASIELEDGAYLIRGNTHMFDPVSNRTYFVPFLTKISAQGDILWERRFVRYEGTKIIYYGSAGKVIEDENGDLFVFGSQLKLDFNTNIVYDGFTTMSKLNANGCLEEEECGVWIPTTDVYPPPEQICSDRNIWHVWNKKTDERYRYRLYECEHIELGGSLMISHTMTGNDWEFTDRRYQGRSNYLIYKDPIAVEEQLDYIYYFDYEVGDKYNYPAYNGNWNEDFVHLEVTNISTTQFLDGREKKMLTLECSNLQDDGTAYPSRTWIEDLGDPSDIFNPLENCRNPGDEIVTCLFIDGELAWENPEYPMCTTSISNIEQKEDITIMPNPANNKIKISKDVISYDIFNTVGEYILSGGQVLTVESIDVSNLLDGLYYIHLTSKNGQRYAESFVVVR